MKRKRDTVYREICRFLSLSVVNSPENYVLKDKWHDIEYNCARERNFLHVSSYDLVCIYVMQR